MRSIRILGTGRVSGYNRIAIIIRWSHSQQSFPKIGHYSIHLSFCLSFHYLLIHLFIDITFKDKFTYIQQFFSMVNRPETKLYVQTFY